MTQIGLIGKEADTLSLSKDYMLDWLFPNNPEWRLGLGDKNSTSSI